MSVGWGAVPNHKPRYVNRKVAGSQVGWNTTGRRCVCYAAAWYGAAGRRGQVVRWGEWGKQIIRR